MRVLIPQVETKGDHVVVSADSVLGQSEAHQLELLALGAAGLVSAERALIAERDLLAERAAAAAAVVEAAPAAN